MSEPDLDGLPHWVDIISQKLDRIAVAMEKLVDIGTRPSNPIAEKPFPWGDPRIPARMTSLSHWNNQRPTTFESFIRIGRNSYHRGHYTRAIGTKSFDELDVIFQEHGYESQWVNS